MNRVHVLDIPTKVKDLTLEDYISGEIGSDWQSKAKKLQIRRWRILKRSVKGGYHATR